MFYFSTIRHSSDGSEEWGREERYVKTMHPASLLPLPSVHRIKQAPSGTCVKGVLARRDRATLTKELNFKLFAMGDRIQ